jgi:hypothetical protein
MKTLKSHLHTLIVVSLLVVDTACISIQHMPSKTQLGTHSVSVMPRCDFSTTSSSHHTDADGTTRVTHYELKCGDTVILIRDNTLTVDGKSYGPLKQGDEIAVDFGKVRVNSELRAEVR